MTARSVSWLRDFPQNRLSRRAGYCRYVAGLSFNREIRQVSECLSFDILGIRTVVWSLVVRDSLITKAISQARQNVIVKHSTATNEQPVGVFRPLSCC